MTPEQREELKMAAMKATPGPWFFSKYGSVMDAKKENVIVTSESEFVDKFYITAASPAAILSLIAQVEALNRKTVELERVYAERGMQIDRLETALQHAKVEALTVPQEPFTYTVDGVVMSPLEYIEYMHRQYAGERLRADQGWERYESANRDRNALRADRVAPTIPAIPGAKEGA